jgi:ADP-ribose pyrophosphatase YjhB (NUDIX family)
VALAARNEPLEMRYPAVHMDRPDWLRWSDALQTIASAGLTYSRDTFDRDRFEQIRVIAAEILSRHTDLVLPEAQARMCAEPGYVTPKVDVRAAIFDDDRVLLVQEVSDGRWSLPGGWADVGESPAEVAAREVREEAGLEVRVARLLAALDKRKHPHPPQLSYVYKLFFLCEVTGGTLQSSAETPRVEWFQRDALPPLSLDRVLPAQVERLFQHRDNPELPADFD